jgi:RNA methyltransferase, TrmH family
VITSATNPRVKRLVALRDRRDRDREGVFIAEGMRAVDRLLAAGRNINELFIEPSRFDRSAQYLVDRARAAGADIIELGAEPMAKASYRNNPEGLIAVCPQWRYCLHDIALSASPLVLVVEAVEKPGNLGAILRTADATGCEAVIVCDPVVDVFNPNVIRAATGVVFSAVVVFDTSPAVAAWLGANQILTVATTPDTDTLVWDCDLTQPTAVLMGAEDDGLTDFWLRSAQSHVRLPMLGQADSLNLSVATSVVLYEAVRQRRSPVR